MESPDLQNLRILRQNGDAFWEEKAHLLRATSIQESIQQWLSLQKSFEAQLQRTAHLLEGNTGALWRKFKNGCTAWSNDPLPMDNLFQSIVSLQGLLDEAGVPSIVIGGIAVAIWGEPRLTRDVDLKILLNRQQADRLLEI